jgi:hypothetical protein
LKGSGVISDAIWHEYPNTMNIRILQRVMTILVLVLVAACQVRGNTPALARPEAEAPDPLTTMNAAFRVAYADLRSQAIKDAGPVIIQSGESMVLIRNGVRTEAKATTPRYNVLKSVAHMPLALYVMLIHGADSSLDEAALSRLRDYRVMVVKARDSIETRELTPVQRDRQLRMFDRSMTLIDAVLSSGHATKAGLLGFTRSQKNDILANAYEAADDQITTMDRQFKIWQAEMSAEERKQLRVAVGTAHMARVGSLAMQYFAVALDEPYEGRFEEEQMKDSDFRLLVLESVFDEQGIANAVGTHLIDADIGNSFFGDSQRMHRDLLADPTEEIISKKFGKRPATPQ